MPNSDCLIGYDANGSLVAREEEWRAIPGHPRYQASELGSVRGPRGALAPYVHQTGYLRMEADGKALQVHRVVLAAFTGGYGKVCRHLNGDPADNRVANLAWGGAKENADDRERHGRAARGERMGSAKLTSTQVEEIRELYRQGATPAALGRKFGVDPSHARRVARGEYWTHTPGGRR